MPAAEKNREANICPTKWKKMTFEAYFMREIAIYSESLTMIEKERKTDNKKIISPHFFWKADRPSHFSTENVFFN